MSFETEQPLISLCEFIIDCPHATPQWTSSGVVVLRNQNIKGGRLDLSNPSFTDEAHYKGRTRRAVPRGGDIVITREAPMGDVCQLPEGLRCCLGQRQVLLRPNLSKVDPRFLLFALQSPYLQRQIGWNDGTGSTVSNLRIPVLEALKIPTPDYRYQIQVGKVLAALDDRIAVLRETNATLEAIAQALFKSWFVDFDPVRAKQQGIAPIQMDESTAALFPAKFSDCGQDALPEGWQLGSILQTATLLSGGTPKTDRSDFWGGPIFWASAKDVSQSTESVLVATERTITQLGLNKSATRLIPAFATVVVARGATTGRMALLGKAMAMNQTCYALASKTDTPIALYCLLRREIVALVNSAHGSVFDTVTTETFAKSRVVIADANVQACFERTTRPLFDKILLATKQARTLATLRDTLLPRLISGQLRIPDAEAQVADATA